MSPSPSPDDESPPPARQQRPLPAVPHDPRTRTRYADGDAEVPAQRPRPLRGLLTVLGVVALLVVALVVIQQSRPGGSSAKGGDGGGSADAHGRGSAPAPDATRPSGHRPVKGTDPATGIPVGYPKSRQGAESAASNYAVASGSSDMFVDAKRDAIIDAIGAPSYRAKWKHDSTPGYRSTAAKFQLDSNGGAPHGMTFVCRTVPVGATTRSFDGSTAKVAVWSNGLIGLAGTGSTSPVTESWFTTTYDLTWTGGDWKITGFRQTDGPAPIQGDERAATAKEIEKAVREFGGFTYAR